MSLRKTLAKQIQINESQNVTLENLQRQNIALQEQVINLAAGVKLCMDAIELIGTTEQGLAYVGETKATLFDVLREKREASQ